MTNQNMSNCYKIIVKQGRRCKMLFSCISADIILYFLFKSILGSISRLQYHTHTPTCAHRHTNKRTDTYRV